MTMETKQLHALSKIYKEAVYGGAKKEAPKDTRMVVTAADKKANTKAYQNYKAGNKAYKAADHMGEEKKAEKDYDGDGKIESGKEEYFGSKDKAIKKAMGKKVKEGYQRDPEQQEKERKTSKQTDPSKDGFTGIGNSIKDIMKQNAAMKKAAAKKTKKEEFVSEGPSDKSVARTKAWMDKKGEKGAPGLKAHKERIEDHKAKRGVKKEAFVNWRHDLKEIPDYDQIPADSKKSNEKISEKKVKNTVKINPDMKEGYGGKKKKKHDCASKVKHEQFGVGDCISEAHDLDENGNVAHYDVEFEEYIVKGVPVEELQILEKHMHEHVIHEKHSVDTKGKKNCGCGQDPCVTYGKQDQKESYETKKTGEVLAAFKRDPKVRKRFEKAAKKEGGPGSAKNRAADDMLQTAKDTAKRKGDTSKSDDRYAYEDHVWDKVADMLTELGKLNDVQFRVEGYQRNPEEGERKERAANKKYEKVRGERTPMPPRGNKRREEFERWYAANVR